MFTSALLAGLRTGAADRDGDGFVTVDEAYDHALLEMRPGRRADAATLGIRWEGNVYLARNPVGRLVALPTLPDVVRDNLDSKRPLFRIAAVQDLASWLESSEPARRIVAECEHRNVADNDLPLVAAEARALLDRHHQRDHPTSHPHLPPKTNYSSNASR